jgi:hypothetical protein
MIVSAVTELSGQGRVTAVERRSRFGHAPAVVVIADEERAYAVERYLFDRGCQVHVIRGEASAEAISAMISAGYILLLEYYSGQNRVLRPSADASAERIWAELTASNRGNSEKSIYGDGI